MSNFTKTLPEGDEFHADG